MRYGLKRVVAPEGYPITLLEAKAHCRVEPDDTYEDELIEALIAGSTEHVDGPQGFLGRALLFQTWDLYLDTFPTGAIEIPLPPLLAVLGVYYLDSAGVEQEMTSGFTVDDSRQPARILLDSGGSWPTPGRQTNAVRVRFECGYQDRTVSPYVDAVPAPIKVAIKMQVGDLFRNRESQVIGTIANKLPWAAEELLRPYRVYLSLA